MRTTVIIAISLAVLGYGNLMAQDKGVESAQTIRDKQVEKLGATKGRVQSKILELQKLVEATQKEAAAVQAEVQRIQQQTSASLVKLVQEENAKPQEMRNVAVTENSNKKTQKLNEMLAEFNNVTWATYVQKTAQLQATYTVIVQSLFPALQGMDAHWVSANLDPEIVITAVAAVEKRLDGLKIQFATAVTDVKAALPVWEAFAAE